MDDISDLKRRLDTQDMLGHIKAMADHLEEGMSIGGDVDLRSIESEIVDVVVLSGMGGSAIAGDIVRVRADLMTTKGDEYASVMSWIGTANNVRKHLIQFVRMNTRIGSPLFFISLEHASYIGYELLRAEMDENYVQD